MKQAGPVVPASTPDPGAKGNAMLRPPLRRGTQPCAYELPDDLFTIALEEVGRRWAGMRWVEPWEQVLTILDAGCRQGYLSPPRQPSRVRDAAWCAWLDWTEDEHRVAVCIWECAKVTAIYASLPLGFYLGYPAMHELKRLLKGQRDRYGHVTVSSRRATVWVPGWRGHSVATLVNDFISEHMEPVPSRGWRIVRASELES